jgi:hypothetical protein
MEKTATMTNEMIYIMGTVTPASAMDIMGTVTPASAMDIMGTVTPASAIENCYEIYKYS